MATSPEAAQQWSNILSDKVVFITGAGGGIGSAISRTSALQGARVVVTDLNKEGADKVAAEIAESQNGSTDRVLSLQLDTVDEQAIEQAVKTVVEKWGSIHVLVNACVGKIQSLIIISIPSLLLVPLILL